MSQPEQQPEPDLKGPPPPPDQCGTCYWYQQVIGAQGKLEAWGLCRYQPVSNGPDCFAHTFGLDDWCYYWKMGGPIAPLEVGTSRMEQLRLAGFLKAGKKKRKKK
jgi:hypothetical protein